MSSWTPKDPPVGQVPSGILKIGSRKKRGRPKRKAAPFRSEGELGTPSTPSQASEGTVENSSKDTSDASSTPSMSGGSLSSEVSPKTDDDRRSVVSAPVSPFAGIRRKTRYSSPRQVPSMRDAKHFAEYTKRYHSSSDIRLVGDVSSYNPPPDGPKLLQAPLHPVQTPGIDVRKQPMRPPRRRMADEDGYFDQETPVDSLPRFFDALPHDYTVDQHAISARAGIEWIDSAGFSPSDVRARRLKVIVPSEDIKNKPDETIWRVTYSCNGLCRSLPTQSEEKLPALATEDSLGGDLLNWAKHRSKDRRRLARRRLSPRATQLRLGRIAKDAKESSNTSAEKETPKCSCGDGAGILPAAVACVTNAESHTCGGVLCEEHPHTPSSDKDVPSSTPGVDELENSTNADSDSENGEIQKDKKKANECACSSFLMISMTNKQSQFGVCTVRMQRESHHPRPRPGVTLKVSPHISHMLHEMAGCFSMTRAKLKIWYKTVVEAKDPHVIWLKSCKTEKDKSYMSQRLPGKNAYTSAMRTSAKAYRINSSPLAAIEVIAARNPEAMIAHRGPRFLGKASDQSGDSATDRIGPNGRERMECVIAPPLARISAILQLIRFGMMMDSSWRNKNAWGAPMSVLVTLNEQHHMIPLAVMISAHADHIAYEYLLREFQRACLETALEVVAGSYRPHVDGVSEADLVRRCRIFLKEGGLSPRFMMIDRSHAERTAIQNVFPNIPFRVCQFHMMQAVSRRLKRIYGRRQDRDILVAHALNDIRACQRCDDKDYWDDHYRELERSVRSRSPDDHEVWPMLDKYLKDEWFNDAWGDAVIDYGLPPDVTRDGPWSTNNYAEACFRTFDRVFLSCRANHRLDRLILVLIDAFFPYYEEFEGGLPRADPNLQTQLFGGLNRWELGCVHPCPPDAVPAAHRHRFGPSVFCVFPPKRQTPQSSTQFCGKTVKGNDVCTCDYWNATGKRCVHLWAMVAYDLLGSVFEFDEHAAIIEYHLLLRGIGVPSHPPSVAGRKRGRPNKKQTGVDGDRAEEEEFNEFWGEELIGGEQSLADSHPRMFETSPVKTSADPVTPPARLVTTVARSDASDTSADGSPVGRRFGSPMSDSSEPEPIDDGPGNSATLPPSSWSHSNPGAPPHVRPLQPNRATKKRDPIRTTDSPDLFAPTVSTNASGDRQAAIGVGAPKVSRSTTGLSRRARKQVARMKPLGIQNTGNDCYILSLVQVMARVDTWDSALCHDFVKGKLGECAEYQLWARVRESLRGTQAVEFPELRPTLFDAGLILSATEMGDPFDLFDRLLPHFDNKGGMYALRELTNVCRFTHVVCDHHDSKFENQPVSAVLVYPLRDSAPEIDSVAAMLEDSIHTDSLHFECDCGNDKSHASFDILSPILTIHVVWGLQSPIAGTGALQIGRPFDIPPVLSFGDRLNAWHLKGVIVRYGTGTEAGHYVAIVPHNGSFWRIDDDNVKIVGNVGKEAFNNAGYPVMIVYELLGSSTFVPPDTFDPWGSESGPFDSLASPPFGDQMPSTGPEAALTSALPISWSSSIDPMTSSVPPTAEPDTDVFRTSALTSLIPGSTATPAGHELVDDVLSSGDLSTLQLEPRSAPDSPPKPLTDMRDSAFAEDLVDRSNRSSSVQWLRDGSGWNGAGGSTPATPTPQPGSASHGSNMPKPRVSFAMPDDRSTSVNSVRPDKPDAAGVRDPSIVEIMDRYHKLDIWKGPYSPARQKRVIWCSPLGHEPSSPSYSTSRLQAVTELSESLKSVQAPLDQPKTDLFAHGLVSGDHSTSVSSDDFSRFVKPTAWFSSSLCDALCTTARNRLDRLDQQVAAGAVPAAASNPNVRYSFQLLPWVERKDGSAFPRFAERGANRTYTSLPWPALGRDRSWRDRNTVGVINVFFNHHFACLAIFGPGRLVIPFDGYGGALDHADLRKRWTCLLTDRLEYELERGWVQSADNEDWIFAPNSSELRTALNWPVQFDSHTCGPLAVSAAVLIMQGLRPSCERLGIPRTPAYLGIARWPIWLRDSLLVMLVEEASLWAVQEGRPNGRLADNGLCWNWIAQIKKLLNIE